MSGFNIERLINLNSFNQGISENETLALSLPTGNTVDLDFESYCYYYSDNTYNNEDISSILNKKNEISGINNWVNFNCTENKYFEECMQSNLTTNINKTNYKHDIESYCNDYYNRDNFLPSLMNSNLIINHCFQNSEVKVKSKVKSIVLFLRANLGINVAKNFKEEVEALGAYVFIAENCKELLDVNNELDGCKRLIVTSADVALNERLTEEISKKKLSNFLGVVLYCGPHAEYHIKWCSRVSSIKFLSQNLIEVRRAISWLFSESTATTNEMPNIGRRNKKVGLQELKKPSQNKINSVMGNFPSLGVQGLTNQIINEEDNQINSTGNYSPFGINNSNPHDNIASMFRTLALETKIATQVNNGQFFSVDN
ncbi:uncharacterized protein cubi_01096 [Cryptosporidium ubiquitum]|uniref:Uncharacterized protein n=1 Tax=Cryptosporidium ubiquitum TaxID=857276 RepID=A0A1J4MML2_9CRYT|nr:uncharacterized protein cubi_01096 [Cryptosporidium ubiquitum]OII74252.1 hypothetical protein cubi_01096 [Cryptosporidium ubiquitum]